MLLTVKLDVSVGLDAAGKTTILYKLKLGEIVTTIPTIGNKASTTHLRGTVWCGCDDCEQPQLVGPHQ